MSLSTETSFDEAVSVLAVLYAEIEKCGFHSQAAMLRGLEVFDVADAEVAIRTLITIPPLNTEVDMAKKYLIKMLQWSIRRAYKLPLAS